MNASRNPTYYDGDLPRELLDAAKRVIAERGLSALTLRSLAREVGVSHAAPGHHFGNRRGLLTRLATEGFEGLEAEMRRAQASLPAEADPAERLQAIGVAYLTFADRERALFALMFQFEQLDTADPDFASAAARALMLLHDASAAVLGTDATGHLDHPTLVVQAWSLVHGLAVLWDSGALSAAFPNATFDRLVHSTTAAFAALVAPTR